MPGPHGGYTEQEMIDAGATPYHPPGNPSITIYYWQPPGASKEIEFTQNPNTQEFKPKAGDNANAFNAWQDQHYGTGNNGAAPTAPSPVASTPRPQADATPRPAATTTPQAADANAALAAVAPAPGIYGANATANGTASRADANAAEEAILHTPLWLQNGLANTGAAGTPSATNAAAATRATTTPPVAPSAPSTAGLANRGGSGGGFPASGLQAQTQDQGAPLPPPPPPQQYPVGYVPQSVFAPGSNYLSTATDRGVPVYGGNDARNQGLLTVASHAPGMVSLVGPDGGVGYNPLAVSAAANGGLRDFNIPFGSVGRSGISSPSGTGAFIQNYQDNPYGNNPIENAMLSGVMVKPVAFAGNGNGQQAILGSESGYAHGGGLQINRPATIIDNATGMPLASLVDSRHQTPETLYQHPGGLSVANHPMMHHYATGGQVGFNGEFLPSSDTTASGTASGSTGFNGEPIYSGATTGTPAEAPPATATTGYTTGSTQPVATAPAPAVTSTPNALGITFPVLPTAPNAPSPTNINEPYGGPDYGSQAAYEKAFNNYESQLGLVGANANADFANQRLGLVNNLLNDNGAQDRAIATAQRQRDTTDYQYGLGGLPKPTEVMPPLGQNGLNGGTLPQGQRWTLLSAQQQYSRMNEPLNAAQSALNAQIDAEKAQADAIHQAYVNAFGLVTGQKSGGSSGGGGASAPAGFSAAYSLPAIAGLTSR